MRPAQLHRIRPDITHPMDCPCPACAPTSPSTARPPLLAWLPPRAPALFAAGMLAGAIAVAATGHLGAALRALVGL